MSCFVKCSSSWVNHSIYFTDGILVGGILFMYQFHNYLRPILLLMYSFWIPQIVTNVIRDSRKPLHPHYILGITVTRLAVPLYIFGCPKNFMRIEPDKSLCLCLAVFIALQAVILLLQNYLGSRWFIPRQVGLAPAFFGLPCIMIWHAYFSCFLDSAWRLQSWLAFFIIHRFCPRNTVITGGLVKVQIMVQIVLFAWQPLIFLSDQMIAWYLNITFVFISESTFTISKKSV